MVAHSENDAGGSGLTPSQGQASTALSPLRATAIVSVGSIVSMAVTVGVSKALALFTGPVGVGLYGLMQSVVTVTVLVVGLGVSAGVVRGVAAARASGEIRRAAALTRAGWLLAVIGGLAAVLILGVTREAVATVALGSRDRSGDVMLLAVAVGLTLLGGLPISLMTATGRVRALTVTAIASSLAGGLTAIGSVWVLHLDGLSAAIVSMSAVGLLVAIATAIRTDADRESISPGRMEVLHAARSLLRFGLPYTASSLSGVGAQLMIPILILNQLDSHAVGIYRSAATISVGYLAFIVASVAQDFYPRLAGAAPSAVAELAERRMRIVLAIAVPLILLTLGLAPLVIDVLYTSDFRDADQVLRWQLVGDLLKLPAGVLAFVLLARAGGAWYLGAELIGGASLVLATAILVNWFGIEGAGIAYLVSFAMYYAAVWMLARRWAPTTPGRLQAVVLGLVVVTIGMNVILHGVEPARSVLFVLAAAAAAFVSIPRLLQHHKSGEL